MGITHLKEFQKPALLGLVEAHEEDQLQVPTLADPYMPNENIFSTHFARDVIKKTSHIAAYIGYGAEPPVMDRDKVATQAGEIAKMGIKYIATEEELLALNQARSDAERTNMIERLVAKADDLLSAIDKQIATSKLQALLTGKFDYNKNGVKVQVDFGVPDEHKKVLTGTSKWDDEEGTPITDLIEWNDQYIDVNKTQADAILMPREVLRKLQTNPEVISEAVATTASEVKRITVNDVQEVLASYDLPPIQIVTQRKTTVNDIYSGEEEVIEYMPKNRVVFVKQNVGKFLLGPTVENDYQPGVVLAAYDKQEPIQSVMRSVAAGFPVIEDPYLLMYADVIDE